MSKRNKSRKCPTVLAVRTVMRTRRAHVSTANVGPFPSEILIGVFESLDDIPSLQSVRLVSRFFERAARPVFADAFNRQVFHPTAVSMWQLKTISECKWIRPHFKTLNISTAKDIPQYIVLPPVHVHLDVSEYQYIWDLEHGDRHSILVLLRDALALLPRLHAICVVDGAELPRFQMSALNGAPYDAFIRTHISTCTTGHQTRYDIKAHRHTLDVIYRALSTTKVWRGSSYLAFPNIKTLSTRGCVSLASLPGCEFQECQRYYFPVNMTQLTRLELAVTDDIRLIHNDDRERTKNQLQYLPDFLALMPNLVELTLHFPKKRRSVFDRRERFYGLAGFSAIASSVQLPHLKVLHFSNLDVPYHVPLSKFLLNHRDRLQEARFSSLAMTVTEWRSFLQFLGSNMNLEWLTFENKLTAKEKRERNAAWEHLEDRYRLSRDDFIKAAKKGTRFNKILYSADGEEESVDDCLSTASD